MLSESPNFQRTSGQSQRVSPQARTRPSPAADRTAAEGERETEAGNRALAPGTGSRAAGEQATSRAKLSRGAETPPEASRPETRSRLRPTSLPSPPAARR